MQIIRSSSIPKQLCGGSLTIGNFDGVHLGHAAIMERLVARAEAVGGPAVVFTFDPHPVRLLRPQQAPPPLTWTDRKAALLAELGVTAMVAFPTTSELLGLEPDQFFQRIVIDQLDAKAIVEGENFYFGRARQGNVTLLGELAKQVGIELDVVPPSLDQRGEVVSSSRVREMVAAGDVGDARELLTRPYRIRGMVTHGAGRGAQIGFATANLDAVDTLLPGKGVYSGIGHCDKGTFAAAINVGPNPTFGEDALKIEAHLIGFSDSIYGDPLEVDFLTRLRHIQPFNSVDDLKQQLAQDVQNAAEVAAPFLNDLQGKS